MKPLLAALAALAALLTVGCGTLVHGSTQQISVTSTPPGATARATCNDGSSVEATTPGTLLLRRNAEGCAITVGKSGYESQTVALTRTKSGAVFGGNVGAALPSMLAGGLIGLLVCQNSENVTFGCVLLGGAAGLLLPGYLDARSGAMYMQRPDKIDVLLRPAKSP
ncbi:MAG TPA: hypothetical protein VI670_06395 [Thermoanaerobaculia bacterium]|jgi:hypothetical protein